jgi:hypothetical protein
MNSPTCRVILYTDANIAKILLFSILEIFMDGVFDGEESEKGSVSTTRRDISSDIFMDESFIEYQYGVERLSFEEFTCDRHTGSGDDRHISIESELCECIVFDYEKNLYHISTDAIRFSITNICICENSFVWRVL